MNPLHIILLHGLGGDAQTMVPIGRRLDRRIEGADYSIIEGDYFEYPPAAPLRGWYYPPEDADRRIESAHWQPPFNLDQAIAQVHGEIDRVHEAGLPHDRIFIIGHSQGGALSIVSGLTYPVQLGGVCSIAGYLTLPARDFQPFAATPYHLQHAHHDAIVNVRWCHYAADYLMQWQIPHTIQLWEGEEFSHNMHPRQIDAIVRWISEL